MTAARILVVEDESVVALGIENRLRKFGYEIAGRVASGEEAVAAAAATRADLVLMDIHLQGAVDGIAAAEEIRSRHGIPVVFLTAYADQATLDRAKLSGPFGYLLKPFEERDLHATVEMALYRHAADRKLSEAMEELEYQKGFFRTLFESSPNPILVVDQDAGVLAVNAAASRLFGQDVTAFTGRLLGNVIGCTSLAPGGKRCGSGGACGNCQVRATVTGALAGGQAYRNRADLEWESGGRRRHLDLLVSASGMDFRGDRMAAVTLEDVTELSSLRQRVSQGETFAGMIGVDPKTREVFDAIRAVAAATVPVLIQGESGTGKELAAQAIHNLGPRAGGPFVPVNCGALPEGLLESELFGHVRGAFTGAVRDKKGRFELADSGSIFLDEVGELSPAVQVKLLRVLQEGAFERVGGEKMLRADVRVISATNRDLRSEVAAGRFREDLFYRLCVVPIDIPPLRERRADIPLLIEAALERLGKEGRKLDVSPQALAMMMAHRWPGNVRELENVLQYAVIKTPGLVIEPEHLPSSLHGPVGMALPPSPRNRNLAPGAVLEALRQAGGNRAAAARILGISRATLYRYLGK